MSLLPLSLYVHIPWCVRKCPYCDFNSHGLNHEVDFAAYIDALLRDLDLEMKQAAVAGRRIETIFFGGGTPSLLPGDQLARFLSGVRERLPLEAEAEITLEANPGAVDAAHFAAYREAGVNRLSIGAQSFSAQQLQSLGRIHDPGQIHDAVEMARVAGFENINLDLMFGLPGQSPDAAAVDLEQAISLQPAHISWYQLTLEPNTRFYSEPPVLPDEDRIADMQITGQQRLDAAGFGQYEVSAYAQPARRCRHNLNYWAFGDYIGIGAGAHGKLTGPGGAVQRRWRVRGPLEFIRNAGHEAAISGVRDLGAGDLGIEFMLNAMRLPDGVQEQWFEQRTGLSLGSIGEQLERARSLGLLESTPGRLRPSKRGTRYLNDLLACFC